MALDVFTVCVLVTVMVTVLLAVAVEVAVIWRAMKENPSLVSESKSSTRKSQPNDLPSSTFR